MSRYTEQDWPYADDPARRTAPGSEPTQPAGELEYQEPERTERDTLLFDLAPPEPPPIPVERDRIWVHLLWEAALLLGVVGVAVAILSTRGTDEFRNPHLDDLALTTTTLLLITSGLAWSLRAGVPNLAVGTLAAGAPVFSPWMVLELGFPTAAVAWVAFLVALAAGLLLAVVVVGFHVPGWAASLGLAVLLVGLFLTLGGRELEGVADIPTVGGRGLMLLGAAAGISVVGSALWAVPRLRRSLGAMRGDRDPARRPAPSGRVGAALALIGSMLLAAAGGVVLTLDELADGRGDFALTDDATGAFGVWFTAFALAAALLGGVSAYGRRAGIFGTVLAVALLTLSLDAFTRDEAEYWPLLVLGGGILVGLVVNRVLETTGREPVLPPVD